jgi:hypothetical protein
MQNPDTRKSSNPNTRDQEHNRQAETPKRPRPEGPDEAKGVEDVRDKSTRTGDR